MCVLIILIYPYYAPTYADGTECVYDGQLYFLSLFSNTYADGAECVYDGQQAREHTTVAELALA